MDPASKLGLKQFEIENDIITEERIFDFDEDKYQAVLQARAWNKVPDYFKRAKISAIAVIKMVTHAKSGGTIEVMGLMQGKVFGDTVIIMDAFPLPVEATETRVNPGAECYEYIGKSTDLAEEVSRLENIIGWYHSHPSYGCWLSGIDVGTQQLYQKSGPMVAVVVDPIRTMSTGKVDIGAFRTYPENYQPSEGGAETDLIPLEKI
jgi:COP9 signalosome complex subunit 5